MPKFKSILIILLLITLTGLAAFAIEQKMMSIQVKKSAVRTSPSFRLKKVPFVPAHLFWVKLWPS